MTMGAANRKRLRASMEVRATWHCSCSCDWHREVTMGLTAMTTKRKAQNRTLITTHSRRSGNWQPQNSRQRMDLHLSMLMNVRRYSPML